MKDQVIKVQTLAWYGDVEVELNFPASWEVIYCPMEGHDARPLSDAEIQAAFDKPIGTGRIRDMARGKKDVVIIFDDLRRPTPVHQILPFVLKELAQAGIEDEHIRFVVARANHENMDNEDFVKKLGADVVHRYRVFNHHTYEHLVNVGKTSRGTQVWVNKEVMSCDLKIGIGAIIPHFTAGFGGGAKLLFPGVSGIESVAYNHLIVGKDERGQRVAGANLGKTRENPIRLDMEEAARMAGLDVVIDAVPNNRRQIVGLFVGDVVQEFQEGIKLARKIYATTPARDADIVVANSYPVESNANKAAWAAILSLRKGGDAVFIAQSPKGQSPLHYLAGRFGTDYGGQMWKPQEGPVVPQARRISLLADFVSKCDMELFGPKEVVHWFSRWPDLLAELKKSYGDKARVAVYPYVTIQCPPIPEE